MKKYLLLGALIISVVTIVTGCTKQIQENKVVINSTPQSVERVEAEILDIENYVRTEATVEIGFLVKDKYYITTIHDNDLLQHINNTKKDKIIVYVQIIDGKYEAVSWKEK